MLKFIFYSPTEIIFGKDTEKETGRLVRKHGGNRVFAIYGGGSAKRSGLLDRVKASLDAEGLEYEFMGGVQPNPTVSTAQKMAEAAIAFKADFILAVGGGSVIDTAKGVAHAVATPGTKIWDLWTKKVPLVKSTPIGVVLTISAAGSELSDSSVLTNDEKVPPTKRGITTDLQRPRFAIMNPELTMTLPKYHIGAGAADIFMHTNERYFTNILGNSMTDEIAEGLFRNIIKFGPIAVNDPTNYEAMSEVMWSSSVSHNGLTGLGAKGDTPRDGDWSTHQLGQAISALYNVTHGASLTAVWEAWSRYVMDANYSRFARFANKVYGIDLADEKAAAEEGIKRTTEFFKSLGMPLSLTEILGHEPSDDEIIALATECTYDRTRTIGCFKTLDFDDIVAIYKMAR